MQCPRCKHPDFVATGTCPQCGFHGDSEQLEELARLEWLLGEMVLWVPLGLLENIPARLEKHYLERREKIRTDLGLGYPPFTPAEAPGAWIELRKHELLFRRIESWRAAGLLKTGFFSEYQARRIELRERLADYQGSEFPETDREQLDEINFLMDAVEELNKRGDFVSPEARLEVAGPLWAEKIKLENIVNPPAPMKAEVVLALPEPVPTPQAEAPPVVPPVPPLRERFWRTVLSERTLQALLFLGIFLLFIAAISFVIWGWRDFPAPVRVAIPVGFTTLFFLLGWLVRQRTHLERSGIALSAIAALLIPIDSYTVYANYGSPPEGWPAFWLVTSLICLVAYILAALQIQSRFFGYITGIAAGSALLAFLEVITDISRDWYFAAASVLAFGFIFIALRLARLANAGRWQVFVEPLRYLALWTPAVLMPLTLGLRLVTRDTYDALHYAMALSWLLGGLTLGWGAVFHRSRSLGMLAASALPVSVYMLQGGIFHQADVNPAWHAFGLALLTPLYLYTAYRLLAYREDPVLLSHGQTAQRWGSVLVAIAALFSLTDLTSGTAAAASHAVLAATMTLSAIVWRQPRTLFAASFFSFTAATFAMTELQLDLNQLGVGWISLAIVHILLVLFLARPSKIVNHKSQIVNHKSQIVNHKSQIVNHKSFLPPLVTAAYIIAGLACLPPLFLYEEGLLFYALGNWIVLSAWGAYLAYRGQPGFLPIAVETKRPRFLERLLVTGALYHWFTALALPFWVWLLTEINELSLEALPLLLTLLAWLLVVFSYRLRSVEKECRLPWRFTGLVVGAVAPLVAYLDVPDGYIPAITLLSLGLLYFANTLAARERLWFYPAGLIAAWGLWLLLDRAAVDGEIVTFILCLLVLVYLLAGLEAERRRSPFGDPKFLAPLYHTGHVIAVVALMRVYFRPLDELLGSTDWTDTMRLWGAADQLILATVYWCFAWGRYQEEWGHIAAWLAMAGGGFIAMIYSRGHGSLAAKGAVIAALMVLAERGLYALRRRETLPRRRRARIRLAWRLYRNPLLVAGWTASVGIIGLALVRNLVLLGGGRVQQTWAALGLLIITSLYALSAWMFRKPRFVWFAVAVVFIPWTLLTNLGWFTNFKPALPDFAISWVALGWLLFLIGLWVEQGAPRAYATPLKTATHLLLPFSMLWAIANTDASLYTVGLSIALYELAAWLDHRRSRQGIVASPLAATKFLYPALGLIPLWSVYWLNRLSPEAPHEHFGYLLLAFGAFGLATGIWLERLAPRSELKRAYGLPAYLTAYAAAIVGTLLVAHRPEVLALTLLYDAVLMIASARIFRSSLWLYPATILGALSLLIALNEANVPADRQGWWLIGLAVVYLLAAWILRRVGLHSYGSVLITMGFALTALSLPLSSLDRVGAIYGYSAAALLYAVSAFWLKQPLLLTPASGLIVVPYAALLQRSTIPAEYYGLSLFPGAVAALALGWFLDRRLGAWRDFPWDRPSLWLRELTKRFLAWWALPLYMLGIGMASMMPLFAGARAGLIALNFLLLAAFYAWAVIHFRLRFWLVMAILTAHYALGFYLETFGLWQHPEEAWLRFLPLTVAMLAAGLLIEKRLQESPPLRLDKWFWGWSRPFYLFVFLDMLSAEVGSLNGSFPGAGVSLVHMLLLGILASIWRSVGFAYLSAFLGFVALLQWRSAAEAPLLDLPIHLAWLALGYGALGFGYHLIKRRSGSAVEGTEGQLEWHAIWELPLQHFGMALSFFSLLLTFLLGLNIVGWSVRALFGLSFRQIVDLETVYMVIWVLSLIGLLYAAAAAVYRRMRLAYLAVGMLLTGWFLYAFFVHAWDNLQELQWYALPAGLYLLGIGFLERQRDHRMLARWLDYAAILLMLGSLFWQTLVFGLWFAMLLVSEGLAAFYWGSARRLRRFFYAGMAGVILSGLGQLLNSLQEVNQWITFGLIGILLVLMALVVERKLEAIKAWQQVLESWE